jgi:hypothetical protein
MYQFLLSFYFYTFTLVEFCHFSYAYFKLPVLNGGCKLLHEFIVFYVFTFTFQLQTDLFLINFLCASEI